MYSVLVHDPTSLLALTFLSCINKGCMYVCSVDGVLRFGLEGFRILFRVIGKLSKT